MSHHSTNVHVYRSNQDDDIDQAPEAEPSQVVNRDDRPRKQKGGLPKKRDTHFLCFPLVTETSVSQLAKSLRHFREVATSPALNDKSHVSKNEEETSAKQPVQPDSPAEAEVTQEEPSDTIEGNVNLSEPLPASNPDLQILPAAAHRPPGTFHLTLGVMDLSTKEEMDRALKLLQELDYADIFGQVLAQWGGASVPRKTVKQDEDSTNTTSSSLTNAATFTKDMPPQISLTGLSTFPAAKQSRVFYAKPCPTPSAPFPLLEFGRAIRRKFREAGFITETRPLALHATIANMRYAVQPKGGRTSKGKTWRYGKDRWTDGQVDARELIKCFDYHAGDVVEYTKGESSVGESNEFVWAENVTLNRVALCKMGAEKSDDEVLGMVYPPIGEKMIFS